MPHSFTEHTFIKHYNITLALLSLTKTNWKYKKMRSLSILLALVGILSNQISQVNKKKALDHTWIPNVNLLIILLFIIQSNGYLVNIEVATLNGTIQSDVLCGLKKVGTKGDMGNNILYSLLLYQPNPCTVNLANSSVLNSNNSKVVFLERDKDKKQETCEYSALVNTTTTNVTRYLVFGFNGGNLNAQAPTDSSVVFIPIAFSKRIIVTS